MCVFFKYNASAYGSTQSNNTDVAECVQPAPTWPLNAKDVLRTVLTAVALHSQKC